MNPIELNAKQNTKPLRFLDGLRGLAALYVMLGHARWILWRGYEDFFKHPGDYTFFEKFMAYGLSVLRYGHEVVFFFFVLSGFVIHLRYAIKLKDSPESAKFDWGPFVYRRARRLYIPLIFAMILTYLCDIIGRRLGYVEFYKTAVYFEIQVFHSANILRDLFGNLFFLMDTYVPQWGPDLWSLKFEWWFYMIYPLFWVLSKRSIRLASGVMAFLFLLSFFPRLWPVRLFWEVFSLMITWWFGVLLADMYAGRIKNRFGLCSLFVLLIPFLLKRPFGILNDPLWALAFAGLISFCLYLEGKNIRLRILDCLKPLGDMSYTLYVIHSPLLILLSGWLMSRDPQHLLPKHFGWAGLGALMCLGVAYLGHLLVEKPFISRKG